MSFASRPQSSATLSSHRPSDRRERRPLQPVTGYPDIPFFERAESVPHPVTQARPETAAGSPMGKVIHMASTGVWIVKLNGRLAEINGRLHWESQAELAADARRAGIALSDLIVHTGSLD